MAKKLINTAAVKEFMFNHGEKVALGTCAFLAVLFGVLGMWRAMSAGQSDSGKRWADALNEKKNQIAASLNNAPPPTIVQGMSKENFVWNPIDSKYASSPYCYTSEPDTSKRINPMVLPIHDKTIQMSYVRGVAYRHQTEEGALKVFALENQLPDKIKVKKGKEIELPTLIGPVVKEGRVTRAVVVHAAFPMKQQVEEFQRALRMNSQKELFDLPREDLPRPLGIDVIKYEWVNGVKDEKGKVLIFFDTQTGKLEIAKSLDDLLRTAIYDEDTPRLLEDWLYNGLATPMPKFGNVPYPRFKLEGFDIAWDDVPEVKNGMTKPPKGPPTDKKGFWENTKGKDKDKVAAADLPKTEAIKPAKLKTVNPVLAQRLFPDPMKPAYNIFHVLGLDAPNPQDVAVLPNPGPNPRNPMQKPGGSGQYFQAWDSNPPVVKKVEPPKNFKDPKKDVLQVPFANWERDALVRFIDPDVVPGRTYQYLIRVRMANPNAGKAALVAFKALADVEELPPSEGKLTPTITIPEEYFLYAVDQKAIDDAKDPKKKSQPADPNHGKDQTPFQIHQWTDTLPDREQNESEYVIGDWMIAKQLMVRRGESIGANALVRVPVWVKEKDEFEVPAKIKDPKNKKAPPAVGFHVDFNKSETDRPILVDFAGGKHMRGNTLEDETAVEALILSAGGTLTVLNSRTSDANPRDGADGIQYDLPESVRRQERFERARDRSLEVQGKSPEPKGGAQKLPGGGK